MTKLSLTQINCWTLSEPFPDERASPDLRFRQHRRRGQRSLEHNSDDKLTPSQITAQLGWTGYMRWKFTLGLNSMWRQNLRSCFR
ncbi:hypothetical protein GN956_G2501 [Arapaima gigas]